MNIIYKWEVPVDDQTHEIGGGRVVHVACMREPDVVQVWTEEFMYDPDIPHVNAGEVMVKKVPVRVVGTGQPYNGGGSVVGTCITGSGRLVWHVVRYG